MERWSDEGRSMSSKRKYYLITAILQHSILALDLPWKTALPTPLLLRRHCGPKRHQSPYRLDEGERTLRVRNGEGRVQDQAPEGIDKRNTDRCRSDCDCAPADGCGGPPGFWCRRRCARSREGFREILAEGNHLANGGHV